MITNKNIELLSEKFANNKLSHVFLIETNDKLKALEDVKELVKIINCPKQFSSQCVECNLCHLINDNIFPNLEIIYSDGQAIKKSQMEELKLNFSKMPFLSRFNTYIIIDAERFNASSANSMLKFIEEPEQNIIGFLVTNNKENVIATIKSRCEIVRAYYETDQIEANDVDIELVKEFIAKTELDNQKGIVFNKKIVDLKLSREQLSTIFKILLDYYLNLFAGNSIYTDFDELLTSLTKKDILRRIELLNDVIDRLNYNVNINLLLDYYLLSLED